ncbi:hypothetical protein D9613_010443 [Agrocybe pediades]|uniref:DUF6533 domain-containing protein n=1 Tax=Agrocybe pediades TaxID=84607 RepID=A0A8H4VI15_9AGAR|nr:hypothetical protein D9613_010443 [Agrocybe pediades]
MHEAFTISEVRVPVPTTYASASLLCAPTVRYPWETSYHVSNSGDVVNNYLMAKRRILHATCNTSFELPNPLTPLAFFPPDLAYQASVSLYVLVGSAAVLIWDILMNLQRDIKMLKRYKLTLSLVVYFISRFSALAYLLGNAVLQTAPLSHCEIVHRLQALYPILIPSTSLLFFFRVRAMYSDNTKVVVFFFLLWLAVIGGSITPIIGVSAMNIGPTDYCINSGLKLYISAACIVPFVHDTLSQLAASQQRDLSSQNWESDSVTSV